MLFEQMSHIQDDIKQKGHAKTLVFCTHTGSKVEFLENLHPGGSLTKAPVLD